MSGGFGIFLRGLAGERAEDEQRERLLAFARLCPGVVFHDVLGASIVRIEGGAHPTLDVASASAAAAIHQVMATLGTELDGWVEVHVPWEHLDPFADHGDILVPGLVLGPPGSDAITFEEYSLGSVEDMESGIGETLAEATEAPDEYADLHEYLDVLRRLTEVLVQCRENQIILHGSTL